MPRNAHVRIGPTHLGATKSLDHVQCKFLLSHHHQLLVVHVVNNFKRSPSCPGLNDKGGDTMFDMIRLVASCVSVANRAGHIIREVAQLGRLDVLDKARQI